MNNIVPIKKGIRKEINKRHTEIDYLIAKYHFEVKKANWFTFGLLIGMAITFAICSTTFWMMQP
jgi:hypothetical protein